MRRQNRRFLMTVAATWLALGAIGLGALSGLRSGVADALIVLPAVPLAFLSGTVNGQSPTAGLLWDSAHGPPFLNGAGIMCVYFIPALLAVLWLRRRPRRPDVD